MDYCTNNLCLPQPPKFYYDWVLIGRPMEDSNPRRLSVATRRDWATGHIAAGPPLPCRAGARARSSCVHLTASCPWLESFATRGSRARRERGDRRPMPTWIRSSGAAHRARRFLPPLLGALPPADPGQQNRPVRHIGTRLTFWREQNGSFLNCVLCDLFKCT